MAKLVLSLSSVISSSKEGKLSSAALGLVKGVGSERPSSAVTQLLTAPARICTCGWRTWGALLHRQRFKAFALNTKSVKMLA